MPDRRYECDSMRVEEDPIVIVSPAAEAESGGGCSGRRRHPARPDDESCGGAEPAEGGCEDEASHRRAVCLFSDERIVSVLSDLVAMLERARYDERPRGRKVLMTKWGRSLFQTCLSEEMRKDFDVDRWFDMVAGPPPGADGAGGFIDPSLWNAEIATDWVSPLLYLEVKSPGFITMLHGIKTIEVRSQLKFNDYKSLHSTGETYGLCSSAAHVSPKDEKEKKRGGGERPVRNDPRLEWA